MVGISPPLCGNGRTLRAVLYARVSTRDKGQDTETQFGALRPWALGRGWHVVGEESDQVTGDPLRRKGDPPGLRRALRMIETRTADVLVVFSADRLVRSATGLLALVTRVQSMHAHVASYQDGSDLDTTTDVGELLVFIRGWWARMQMKTTRAASIAGVARARSEGRIPGRRREVELTPAQLFELHELRACGWSWKRLADRFASSAGTVRRRFAESVPYAIANAPEETSDR